MERMPGLDTLQSNNITLPEEIHVTFALMSTAETLKQVLNAKGMGFIPYCLRCRVPLDWIRSSEVLFECPTCHTKWIKDVTWKEQAKLYVDEQARYHLTDKGERQVGKQTKHATK